MPAWLTFRFWGMFLVMSSKCKVICSPHFELCSLHFALTLKTTPYFPNLAVSLIPNLAVSLNIYPVFWQIGRHLDRICRYSGQKRDLAGMQCCPAGPPGLPTGVPVRAAKLPADPIPMKRDLIRMKRDLIRMKRCLAGPPGLPTGVPVRAAKLPADQSL